MNKQINLFCIALVLSTIIFTSCPPPPEAVAVTGVSLSQSEVTLNVNESVTLTATVSPENASNKNVSWSSNDETVATVDTNGLVKALKAGTATITVKTEDGEKTATCSVTVTSMVKLELKGKSFQMGADYTGTEYNPLSNEKPVHKVTFTRDIYMCDHEVTQKEWEAVMGNNPSYFQGEEAEKKIADGEVQENRPVECVRWYAAIAYCNKLSIKDGLQPCYSVKVGETEVDWENLKYENIPTETNAAWNAAVCDFSKNGYRLPTEAEREYAARGGETAIDKPVWAGTTTDTKLEKYAWYSGNSNNRTHEVKKKLPNGYGLYDMSGNVDELCWDWRGNYTEGDSANPTGASSGTYRVIRGGSYLNPASAGRASYRNGTLPAGSKAYSGFRLVRTVQQAAYTRGLSKS